jgi:hypothetical protein
MGACVVLIVLLAAPSARAAAPWCDELAQTIAAPPPIVAQHGGEIRAWKCGDNGLNAVQQSPASPDQKPQTASPETSDKALGVVPAWPPPPNATRLPKPEAERAGRPGHSLAVYRPPRG